MQNIDQEAQDYLRSPAEVAQAERDSGPRQRLSCGLIITDQRSAHGFSRGKVHWVHRDRFVAGAGAPKVRGCLWGTAAREHLESILVLAGVE